MRLYRTATEPVAEEHGEWRLLAGVDWDDLIQGDDLAATIRGLFDQEASLPAGPEDATLLPPLSQQEVWAAGVTYFRSREARMEESKQAGGDDFYARVYSAARPELFFKAPHYRVVGHRGNVRIRRDSQWNVPEPELALVINPNGAIVGYTVGNDMSSRDIEGENPLYLPQAKVYDGACALGPGILLAEGELSADTPITLEIRRAGAVVFQGATKLEQLKRRPEELVEYLYRETSFPHGCVLLTGTGVVPPAGFTLEKSDLITISIPPVGTLINTVGD